MQCHSTQPQTLEPDGHIHLTFPYVDQRELVRDLLRFAGEVGVLAPPSLRSAVIHAMRAGLEKHRAGEEVAQPVSQ